MVAEIIWLIYSINLHPVCNLVFLICTWCKNHTLLRHFASFPVSGVPGFDGISPICMAFLRFQSERLKHTEGKETQRVGIEELKQTARTQESHHVDQVGLELMGIFLALPPVHLDYKYVPSHLDLSDFLSTRFRYRPLHLHLHLSSK